MAGEQVYVDKDGLTLYNSLTRGDTTPNMDGIGATGTSKKFARADHVHPSDTSKVDKVEGKGLSENDFTDALKDKLDGVSEGAEVNVQSDWDETNSSSDAYIANKPQDLVRDANYVHTDNNYTASEKTKLGGIATGAEVNVQSDWNETNSNSDAYIANKPTIPEDPKDIGAIPVTEKGAASGVASLDASGKVPTSQLPSYVDDVIESYPVSGATELSAGWLSATSGGAPFTPEAGKIYILMVDSTSYAANTQFRWGGTAYVKMLDGGIRAITSAEIQAIVNS